MWWTVASAAEITVPVTVSLAVGEPAHGSLSLDVPLPSRVPPTGATGVDVDGFGLRCTGRGRSATVDLRFAVESVPAQVPETLRCAVGSHSVVIALHNDQQQVVTHPTVRAGGRTEAAFELPADLGEATGRGVTAAGLPVDGFRCRVSHRMLHVETEPGVPVGSYRCLVEGQEPLVVEVVAP